MKDRMGIKEVKCVVWDLDGTLWDGILLEGDEVSLKPGLRDVITTLDSRGILHSIASKNDPEFALAKVAEFGLDEFFLYPEINWNAKSSSIKNIQENLNIGMDTILFLDDRPFERDEVKHVFPEVECVDASEYLGLPDHPRLNPRFITEDSQRRRSMYIADEQRKKEEGAYQGPRKEFLASLGMRFIISEAGEDDLRRAEELTMRTNQLNSTGVTYDFDQLKAIIHSEHHKLFVCEMSDRYGSYGKIGLSLVEISECFWHLRLLLMSCRVMSYGVGTIMLSHIMQQCKKTGKKLRADFIHTGRNRMMYATFKFADFKELESDENGNVLLENELQSIQSFPDYMDITIKNP
jgi:FkbH-like protein